MVDGPPRTKPIGFCDLLGAPKGIITNAMYAPVSKIPSVKETSSFRIFFTKASEYVIKSI